MGNYKPFSTSLIHSVSSILIIYLMTSNSISALDFWRYDCPGTTNMFDRNTNYEANLNTLFDYLTTNSTNPSGYHQAAVNNTVYGHFQCRNDLPTSTCQDCVATAINRDIPTYCPNQKVAILWYSQCLVRYSNQLFFGQIESYPVYVMNNQLDDVTGNVTHFDDILGNMMDSVIAVRAANGGDKKFAAYSADFTDKQTIFGMGQCTSDLSPIYCKICLVYGFNIAEYSLKWGAKIYSPSCILRYEMYPFFDLSLLAPPPPPPQHSLPRPPPSSGSYGGIKRKHHHRRRHHHHHG